MDMMTPQQINAEMHAFYPNALALIGKKFGRWTVLAINPPTVKGGTEYSYKCRCDCGVESVVRSNPLRTGRSKSCGCINRERSRASAKHGHARKGCVSSEWKTWHGMRERCNNASNPAYRLYGGRGNKLYWSNLRVVCLAAGWGFAYREYRATAPQRCEAFLKSVGYLYRKFDPQI